MNIKTFMALAVVALTAACQKAETEVVDVPANEAAAAQVELNEDGSVAKEANSTEAAQ